MVRLLSPLAATKRSRKASTNQDRGRDGSGAVDNPAAAESLRRLLPAALYRLGRTQVELKDWAAAAATLDRLLAEFPDNPYRREARYLLAESALRQGDAGAAEKGFAALLAEPPATADPKGMVQAVRLKRIQCWVALKRWKDALDGAAGGEGPAGRRATRRLPNSTIVTGSGVARAGPNRGSARGVSGGHRGSQGRRAGGTGPC